MSLPTMQNVVIRGALQQVSQAYRNPMYIGDQVFPIINGLNTQTRILKYDRVPWFQNNADYRAEGTSAKRGDYTLNTHNIDPKQIAIAKQVTDELFFASNEPGNLPIQPIQEALLFCADKIDLFKEVLIADTIFGRSLDYPSIAWADGAAGGTDLNATWAATSSNPFISDVLSAKKTILQKTGQVPNTLVMDYGTFLKLQSADCILDRIKYTQSGVITAQLMAAVLQLDNVLVGQAIYTTQKETKSGQDTLTSRNIWELNAGKGSAFLYYRPAAPGLRTPSPGYQYRLMWDGAWRRSISWREEWNHVTVYEVSERIQISPLGTDLGYLWKDTIVT